MPDGADVVLVTMPFAPVTQPSLALSLLKGMVEPGQACINYETIRFAEEIGIGLYDRIGDGTIPTTHLVGEWLFAEAAFGPDSSRDEAYLAELLRSEPRTTGLAERAAPIGSDLTTELFDCRDGIEFYLEGALDRVLEREPALVGFTSVFQQQVASLALAARIKAARPDTVIVMGGANCEGPMGAAIVEHFDAIDVVVNGEGEVPFRSIVDHVARTGRPGRVVGAITRADGGPFSIVDSPPPAAETLEMDALPVPDYDDFFEIWSASSLADQRTPFLLFESARGCWWGALRHCTFCGLNGDRMSFRSKSPERALAELRAITAAHPGLPLYAVDNIIDRDYFDTVLPELADAPCDAAAIFYEVKANLTKDQLARLRDAGVRDIQPGVESLHDSVLRIMRKGVTALDNIQLLKWCAELGLRPQWNLLFGFPGEPAIAFTEMAAMFPLLAHLTPPGGAGRIRLDRFSPNFDDAAELGFANVRPVPAYEAVYRLDEAALRSLAYYFDFDATAPVDHRDEIDLLRRAAAEWQDRHDRCGLWSIDTGDTVIVWDFRDEPSTSTRYTGLERDLLIAVDACRSVLELAVILDRPRDEVIDALAPLVHAGFVVTDGRRYVGLPVQLGDRSLPAPFLARMATDLVGSIRGRIC